MRQRQRYRRCIAHHLREAVRAEEQRVEELLSIYTKLAAEEEAEAMAKQTAAKAAARAESIRSGKKKSGRATRRQAHGTLKSPAARGGKRPFLSLKDIATR